MTYKQLEANLQYTQDMYHKHKNEHYITQPNIQPITHTYTQQHAPTNTLNLTQDVTDVTWQPHNQHQQTQQHTNNFNNQQNDTNNSNSQQPQNNFNNNINSFKSFGALR
eukprot:132652_1